MLQINQRYVRKSPTGEGSIVIIKTEEELDYHQDLMKEGFTYTEVKPAVDPSANVCESCSA